MAQFVWMGNSGCLLPILIVFNLFFGRAIFNSTYLWLGVEAILILLFMLKVNIMASKLRKQFWPEGRGSGPDSRSHWPEGRGSGSDSRSHKPRGEVIDVEGEVVEEKKKLN